MEINLMGQNIIAPTNSLETKDLILKTYDEKYLSDTYNNFFCQQETAKYLLWKPTTSIEEAKERLERWSKDWNLFYLIIEKKTDTCIGYLGVDKIEKDIYGRLGICLGLYFKNKGYGTQALIALINYLKLQKAKELHYSHFKENISSQKLAEKIGFKRVKEDKRIRKWDNKEFEEYFYVLNLDEKIMKEIKLKNGEVLTITSPTLDDAQNLADFANTIRCESRFITMSEEDEPSTKSSQEKWVQNTLNNNRSFIFSAKINDKLVGSGNFCPKSNKARLAHRCDMGVSVLKAYWGLGIASEIMKVIIDKAKEAGFEQIELQVVEENASARHLYKKFGFYETGYINHGMKYADGTYTKLILMQKDLK